MMAIENNGWPIIGRMATRSTISPMTAARISASSTDSDPLRATRGRPIHRPGICCSTARVATKKAPTAAMAPWAKLTTCVALKMTTKPRASRA